jgi:hypothetical protein
VRDTVLKLAIYVLMESKAMGIGDGVSHSEHGTRSAASSQRVLGHGGEGLVNRERRAGKRHRHRHHPRERRDKRQGQTGETGVTYVCSVRERALVGNRELDARCGSGMERDLGSRPPWW